MNEKIDEIGYRTWWHQDEAWVTFDGEEVARIKTREGLRDESVLDWSNRIIEEHRKYQKMPVEDETPFDDRYTIHTGASDGIWIIFDGNELGRVTFSDLVLHGLSFKEWCDGVKLVHKEVRFPEEYNKIMKEQILDKLNYFISDVMAAFLDKEENNGK
jgi:hypothetical protein